MNSLVSHLPPSEQVFARADRVIGRWYGHPGGSGAESRLAVLDAALLEAKAVLADLHAAGEPASDLEIGKHLGVLVKAFPNRGSADRETYGGVLLLEVIAEQPSVSDVEAACRKLWRNLDFVPSIAEVLKAVAAAKIDRERTTRSVASIVNEDRDRLVMRVEEEKKLRQEKEANRLLQLEQDRKRREEDFW